MSSSTHTPAPAVGTRVAQASACAMVRTKHARSHAATLATSSRTARSDAGSLSRGSGAPERPRRPYCACPAASDTMTARRWICSALTYSASACVCRRSATACCASSSPMYSSTPWPRLKPSPSRRPMPMPTSSASPDSTLSPAMHRASSAIARASSPRDSATARARVCSSIANASSSGVSVAVTLPSTKSSMSSCSMAEDCRDGTGTITKPSSESVIGGVIIGRRCAAADGPDGGGLALWERSALARPAMRGDGPTASSSSSSPPPPPLSRGRAGRSGDRSGETG
mmetsp:Transcript_26161/g.91006  ORF Transcript_26161/g.91006 Transcript_26161/m.91006 type:complete len:285 (-) Transcript_26161:787-1641(-)